MGRRFTIMPEIYLRPVRVLTDEGLRETSSSSLTDGAVRGGGGGGRSSSALSSTSTPSCFYDCPVYKTTTRADVRGSANKSANFVTSLRLPSDAKPARWTMRGVALVAQLDV